MSTSTVYFTVRYISEDGRYTLEEYSFPTKKEAELYVQEQNAKLGDRTWFKQSFEYVISITEENYGLPVSISQ